MKFSLQLWTLAVIALLCGCTKEGSTNLKVVDDVCTQMDDIKFMQYCYDNFDVNHDGKVSLGEAKAVRRIDVPNMGIYSLKGLEYFPEVDYLSFNSNLITSVDVSKLTRLSVLNCSYNNISSLIVTNNIQLTQLDCSNNEISTLDVSSNTRLTTLDCSSNRIATLDVSKNERLIFLYCHDNILSTLDVSSNESLYSLSCNRNKLTVLDLSSNTSLVVLIANPQKENKTATIIGLHSSNTEPPLPSSPSGLKLLSSRSSSLTFQWDAGENATSYNWEIQKDGSLLHEGSTPTRNATINGLQSNTLYRFSVRSVNASG